MRVHWQCCGLAVPPLPEALDRLIPDEVHSSWTEQSWAMLHQAGLPQAEDVLGLAEQLEFVHETLAGIERSLGAADSHRNGQAAELVSGYASAQQRRGDLIRRFSDALRVEPDHRVSA